MNNLVSRITVVADAGVRFEDIHSSGEKGRGYATGAAILINDDSGRIIGEYSEYFGDLSVGEAEYQAVIFGLNKASEVSRGSVTVWSDSQFVVKHLNGEFYVKDEEIKKLHFEVKRLEQNFSKVRYLHHNRISFLAREAHNLAQEEYKKHGV